MAVSLLEHVGKGHTVKGKKKKRDLDEIRDNGRHKHASFKVSVLYLQVTVRVYTRHCFSFSFGPRLVLCLFRILFFVLL